MAYLFVYLKQRCDNYQKPITYKQIRSLFCVFLACSFKVLGSSQGAHLGRAPNKCRLSLQRILRPTTKKIKSLCCLH